MKTTTISIIAAVALIAAAFAVSGGAGTRSGNTVPENNVMVVDGRQIIEIRAKGGYTPQKSVAQAGVPTILRFNTENTFDCSSSIRIPGMNINKMLPQSGFTDIDIGTSQVATLQGTCSMGMYSFEVEFKS